MGDFGPSFFPERSALGVQTIYRCDECGSQQAAADGSCRFCGGTLRSSGNPSGSERTNATPLALEDLTSHVLQQIVPTALFEELALPQTKPADESVVSELPLVRIEPYIQIKISQSTSTISRDVLASAAERRRSEGSPSPAYDSEPPHPASGTAPAEWEIRGTGSTFGKLLTELEHGVSGRLVIAEPPDGASELRNSGALAGAVVLMWRGGCSFVDKVRRAQLARAAGCLVVQTQPKWPFSMSDTTGAGVDIDTPSAMIRLQEGEQLRAALEAGVELHAHLESRDQHTSCAVCLQEMIAEQFAVRLPCNHTFHEDCVRQWLTTQHTCPTCRARLPEQTDSHSAQATESLLPSWLDFSSARSGRAPPSTAMYS